MSHSPKLFGASKKNGLSAVIQLPSSSDLMAMRGLPAGEAEDQSKRLAQMTECIRENVPFDGSVKLTDSDFYSLSKEWEQIFLAVRANDVDEALKQYQMLPSEDAIKSALLSVHTETYLEKLLAECARHIATAPPSDFSTDVLINNGSFESLIRDLVVSLNQSGILLAFGLPTHHAYADAANGFCLLNKTAILIRQCQAQGALPIIIGTDVNRDDGLNQILNDATNTQPFLHIDIYDSRVYPWHPIEDVAEMLAQKGFNYKKEKFVNIFSRGEQQYHLIDLKKFKNEKTSMHPALFYACSLLETRLNKKDKPIQIFLPTGWDSHKDETAGCSVILDQNSLINKYQLRTQRFKDSDFEEFFSKIFSLAANDSSTVSKILFTLEGGYNPSMYQKQITILINTLISELTPEASMDKIRPFDML